MNDYDEIALLSCYINCGDYMHYRWRKKSHFIFADKHRGDKLMKWPFTLNATFPFPVSGTRSKRVQQELRDQD